MIARASQWPHVACFLSAILSQCGPRYCQRQTLTSRPGLRAASRAASTAASTSGTSEPLCHLSMTFRRRSREESIAVPSLTMKPHRAQHSVRPLGLALFCSLAYWDEGPRPSLRYSDSASSPSRSSGTSPIVAVQLRRSAFLGRRPTFRSGASSSRSRVSLLLTYPPRSLNLSKTSRPSARVTWPSYRFVLCKGF